MRASRERSGSRPGSDVRTAAGLVVAGLVLGGLASVVLRSGGEVIRPSDVQAAPSTVSPAKPVAVPPAKSAVAQPAKPGVVPPAEPAVAPPAKSAVAQPVKPAVAPATKPAVAVVGRSAVSPASAKSPVSVAARPVSASGAVATVKGVHVATPVARPSGVRPLAHLDEHVTYQYNALGRRDPFQPLIGGEFVGDDVGGDAPVDVGGLKVVGIVWGASDRFALVEDGRGNSLVLRTGDKVMNGVVEALQREALVVRLTVDGQSQSVAIPLTRKGDQSNATR